MILIVAKLYLLGIMGPTISPLPMLLFALGMTGPIFCTITTSRYKLHAFNCIKSCPDSNVALILNSRVICAAVNNPHPGRNFSLQLVSNSLVCANTSSSESSTCQQAYSHSTVKQGPNTFHQGNETFMTTQRTVTTGNR